MARWDVRLAKQFKKRDNEEKIGAIVGIVEGIDPLTVSIYKLNIVFLYNFSGFRNCIFR